MWIVWLAVGYCVAVLFPVPGVSLAIINGWKALWIKIREK